MRLSIIIPVVSGQHELEDTLVSVLSNRPDDCEVLVVHSGSYSDPYDLGDEVRFIEADRPADHIGLAEVGIQASRGEVVHLLAPGIEAVDGWTELPVRWLLRDPSVGAVSPLIVAADEPRRTISAGVRYACGGTRSVTGEGGSTPEIASYHGAIDGPTIHGAFYRRSAMVSIQGFDPFVGEQFADIDLAIRLQELGYRCVFAPERPLLGRWDACDDRHGGFRQGRFAERLFWRHMAYGGRLRSLLMHPIEIAIDTFRQSPRPSALTGLAGRLAAILELARGTPLASPTDGSGTEGHSVSSDGPWTVNRSGLREAG